MYLLKWLVTDAVTAEHAADLCFALFSLHNNFDLDNFDQQRQDALASLVACCPQRSAP